MNCDELWEVGVPIQMYLYRDGKILCIRLETILYYYLRIVSHNEIIKINVVFIFLTFM